MSANTNSRYYSLPNIPVQGWLCSCYPKAFEIRGEWTTIIVEAGYEQSALTNHDELMDD
jgi:hypothetical protein